MADAYTPILNLTLPEVGASRDSWGQKCNSNFSTLDSYVGFGIPVGMIIDFAGTQAPNGWLVCDGRAVSRVTYAALFAVIGTAFGAGDGSTNFNLPNLNGRACVGPGAMTDDASVSYTFTFATAQGFVSNYITQSTLPNYALYCDVQGNHSHGGATAPGGNHTHSTDVQGSHSHGGAVGTGYAQLHVSDPQHAHTIDDYFVGGSGSIAGGAGYGNVTIQHVTYNAATGISVSDSGHNHGIGTDGAHGHNISYSGNLQLGINADGNHSHNVYLNGSGSAFEVLGPILVVTKVIFAGNQAFAHLQTQAAPTIEGTFEEMDELRAEVAELRDMLRQLLPQRRALSSPLRGTH